MKVYGYLGEEQSDSRAKQVVSMAASPVKITTQEENSAAELPSHFSAPTPDQALNAEKEAPAWSLACALFWRGAKSVHVLQAA